MGSLLPVTLNQNAISVKGTLPQLNTITVTPPTQSLFAQPTEIGINALTNFQASDIQLVPKELEIDVSPKESIAIAKPKTILEEINIKRVNQENAKTIELLSKMQNIDITDENKQKLLNILYGKDETIAEVRKEAAPSGRTYRPTLGLRILNACINKSANDLNKAVEFADKFFGVEDIELSLKLFGDSYREAELTTQLIEKFLGTEETLDANAERRFSNMWNSIKRSQGIGWETEKTLNKALILVDQAGENITEKEAIPYLLLQK